MKGEVQEDLTASKGRSMAAHSEGTHLEDSLGFLRLLPGHFVTEMTPFSLHSSHLWGEAR